jgi:PAS domain S-box-containing protein
VASVVVAEDNLDHQRVIAEVVRRLGHEPTVAADGRTGLAAVADKRPALVVADVDMPGMDGLAMCRAIRADPALARIPVVLVTAYLPPSDARLSYADATAVVHKPFRISELSDVLRPLLELPPASSFAGAGADPAFVEALLQSLDTGVVACDTGGRLVIFNEMLRDLFGESGASVRLDDWPGRFQLRHHDGTPLRKHELTLRRALGGERVQDAEILAYDTQGRPHYCTVNARPIHAPDGALLGAVAAIHDTTNEYRARQYLTCKTEVLRVLAGDPETATAASQLVEAIGRLLGWPYVRLWLVDEVTDVLRPVAMFTAEGERPLPVPASVACGQGLAGRCWERGELIWVPDIQAADSPVLPEVTAETMFRAAGAVPVRRGDDICGVLSFFSHSRQEPDPALAVLLTGIAGTIGAHLERRRADVLTEHLAAATDEYIALVGHELRTPLTSIGSYVDLLADSPDDTPIGEVRDLLAVVQRNSTRLRMIVERLLDLAALESGHARMRIADVDLAAVAGAVVAAMSPVAWERRITVAAELPPSLVLAGDADRLHQVVESLLDNAVKFSPEDAVVTVRLATDQGAALLVVADHGMGVPAEAAPHLFRRLFRADNARHNGMPGAGLGLALSRLVVEQHHGTITLSSHPSTGTTVTVRLPID